MCAENGTEEKAAGKSERYDGPKWPGIAGKVADRAGPDVLGIAVRIDEYGPFV